MVVVGTLQIAANVLPVSCLVDPTAGVWRDLPGLVGYRLLLGEQEIIITLQMLGIGSFPTEQQRPLGENTP